MTDPLTTEQERAELLLYDLLGLLGLDRATIDEAASATTIVLLGPDLKEDLPVLYLRLRDRVSAAGSDVPILAGVMPVTNLRTIERSEQLSGAPFPERLGASFQALAGDPAAVRALGIEQASELTATLLAEGVPGIHFITFNRSKAIREVWSNIHGAVPALP